VRASLHRRLASRLCEPVRECESDNDCPALTSCEATGWTVNGQSGTKCSPGACNSDQDCPAGDQCLLRESEDGGLIVTRGTCPRRPCNCTADCPFGSRCGSDFGATTGFCYPESPPCQTDADCDPKLQCRLRENPACVADGGVTTGTCQARLCSMNGPNTCTGGQICAWVVCVDPADH